MLAVLIYGFGWIFLLTSILGHDVSFIETLFVAFLGYITAITLFGNKKRVFISVRVLSLLSGGGFLVMYLLGKKDLIIDNTRIFILPFLESMSNEGPSIDITRQIAAIFLITLLIYIIMLKYKEKKYSGYGYMLISIITLAVGFVENRLNSLRDRYSFIFFVFCSIVYYFYTFYKKNTQEENIESKGAMPFINIAIIYTICIIGISQMLFLSFPYPFQQKQKNGVSHMSNKNEDPSEKFNFEVAKSGNIEDEFVFEGIELFKVKTQDTKYLKSIVYDTYTNNIWIQSEALQETENKTFNTLKELGEVENVVVNYTGIQTPILFAGPYINNFNAENPAIIIAYDENRGTYRIENYVSDIIEKDIIFSFDSLNVKSDTPIFKETLREVNLQITPPQYEGYNNERIHELALKITEGTNTDYDKIQAIIRYLNDNYTYNHTPKVANNGDADKIEYFLFESKEGFCQHYSSAAVLLLRSINISARYVTGFKIDTVISFSGGSPYLKSLSSGYKPVYDSDAHAWVEVYFKDYGWIMFESTGIDGMTTTENEKLLEDEEEVVEENSKISQETIKILMKIGLYLAIPIILTILIYMLINIRKSKNNFRKGTNAYKVKILYTIILDYLKAIELPKFDYETPQEHAKRIDAANIIVSEYMFGDLILTYNQIVYGEYEVGTNFVSDYYVYLRQIKKELKKHCKFHKRVKISVKEFINT